MRQWIGVSELARLAGVTRQYIHRVVSHKSLTLLGAPLQVRRVRQQQGGRSGVCYEIRVVSLPTALKASLAPLETPSNGLRNNGRPRADKGDKRCILWRSIDSGRLGFDEESYVLFAEKADRKTKGVIDAGASRGNAAALIAAALIDLARLFGCTLPDGEIFRLCTPPDNVVRNHLRDRRNVRRKRSDAKEFFNVVRPRVLRDWRQTGAGDLFTVDATKLPYRLRRDDGSETSPWAMGTVDGRTRRLFMSVWLLDSRRGISTWHAASSFIAAQAAFGMPKAVMFDNGPEFTGQAFMSAFKQGFARWAGTEWEELSPEVHLAAPYNAPAKIAENVFGVLNRMYYPLVPGYHGKKLGAKKSAHLGKAPPLYPGTFDQFVAQFQRIVVDNYNATPQPQSDVLRGLSPNEAWNEEIDRGYLPRVMDPCAAALSFSSPTTRVVTSKGIRQDGRFWWCDGLAGRAGETVNVLIPNFNNWGVLPVDFGDGSPIEYAEPQKALHPVDPSGAQEAARRQGLANARVRALAREADRVDLGAVAEKIVELHPRAKQPRRAPVPALSDQHTELAARIAETPDQRRDREHEQRERRLDEEMKLLGPIRRNRAERLARRNDV